MKHLTAKEKRHRRNQEVAVTMCKEGLSRARTSSLSHDTGHTSKNMSKKRHEKQCISAYSKGQ
jgi:hypothetical protein